MMVQIKAKYQAYQTMLENIIFPVILCLYPLWNCNQGIDVSDTTYSLSNFQYFFQMEGMWAIATYIANVVGALLVRLPFGNMLLGMNIYTSLIVSAIALLVYYFMRGKMHPVLAFIGEIVAIGLCWIPTTILYNYLTYLLLTAGAVFVYRGIVKEKNSYLIIAGIFLGLNVMVRTSNLTQMALIVGLWYSGWYRKEQMMDIAKKTGYCVLGYVIGIGIPLCMVLIQYGFGGIADVIEGLAGIQQADDTYTFWSMIMSTVGAYIRSGKWMLFIVAGIILGTAMFAVARGKYEQYKKLAYCVGIAILLRFFWGRGMFSFRYYEPYTSVFEWVMVFLYFSILGMVLVLVQKKFLFQEKVMGALVLIILLITPLGSNNYTYQNMNNLFLAMPYTCYVYYRLIMAKAPKNREDLVFPWKAMMIALGAVLAVQSVGFHNDFIFRDGMDGVKRDADFVSPQVVWGMSTTYDHADAIGSLMSYCEENQLQGEEAIFYGDIPGMSYLLQMPFAIGSPWSDLDSFSLEKMQEELGKLESGPIIIMKDKVDGSKSYQEKEVYLKQYMDNHGYEMVYEKLGYSMYRVNDKK